MEQFYEKTTTNIEIKVVKGIITTLENETSPDYDLYYWANFIPHFDNKKIKIVGECGFDFEYEKKDFDFNYYIETDTIIVYQPYRITTCSDEIYNRYSKHIYYNDDKIIEEGIILYNNNKKIEGSRLPWIRFPRTKDGFILPELIEKILGRIPSKIIFY